MDAFLKTNAGRGTTAVVVACLILAWPPAINWLTAAVSLVFGVTQLRESFRKLDAETPAAERSSNGGIVVNLLARDPGLPCDMEAVMATLAAPSPSKAR